MKRWLVVLILFIFILSSCIVVKFHDYADTNIDIAKETITRLKNDTLLIVIPTFHQKEKLLKSLSRRGKDRKKNKQKLLNLYAERQIIQESMIRAFLENYSFSPMLFIPDSLVTQFESGKTNHYFLNELARVDSTIHFSNRKPLKLVQQFDQEWHIKIGNKLVPNPFPNHYLYRNGLYGFLGYETYNTMYDRVASTFQKRFEQFYKDPDSRLYL